MYSTDSHLVAHLHENKCIAPQKKAVLRGGQYVKRKAVNRVFFFENVKCKMFKFRL